MNEEKTTQSPENMEIFINEYIFKIMVNAAVRYELEGVELKRKFEILKRIIENYESKIETN